MKDYIVFRVAKELYSLNIENIERIVEFTNIRETPNNSKFIKGVLNYKDDIINVINLDKILSLNSKKNSSKKILIYSYKNIKAGLIVDDIKNIIHLNSSNVNFIDVKTKQINFVTISKVIELNLELICLIDSIDIESIIAGKIEEKKSDFK